MSFVLSQQEQCDNRAMKTKRNAQHGNDSRQNVHKVSMASFNQLTSTWR